MDTKISITVEDETDKMVLRMRQNVMSLDDPDSGKEIVNVGCGAGLGGDFVTLNFTDPATGKEHQGVFYLRDAVAEWVATINPEAAKQMPRTGGQKKAQGRPKNNG